MDQQVDLLPEPEGATPVITAKQAAESILLWAKQNHLFAKGPVEDSVEEEQPEMELLPQQFFEAQTVKAVLRKRAINLVVFSEAERKVIIFTHAKLNKTERGILPFHAAGGITVSYAHGGVAMVRGGVPSPDQIHPYALHSGKICCGSSIHPVNCLGAGTFGAIVRDAGGRLFGLTNNHVSGACNCAAPGLPILCPGPIDADENSISPFTIGRHARLMPINEGIPENIDVSANMDAALFEIEDPAQICSMQGALHDTPSSVLSPYGGMRVEKFGRTSGATVGTVIGESAAPLAVGYSIKEYGVSKTVFFESAFLVEGENGSPFSKSGDSGSLVVGYDSDGNRHAVGIVFAGNEARNLSFILPLPQILNHFEVELVYGHNV